MHGQLHGLWQVLRQTQPNMDHAAAQYRTECTGILKELEYIENQAMVVKVTGLQMRHQRLMMQYTVCEVVLTLHKIVSLTKLE